MRNKQHAEIEFETSLDLVLRKIRERAESQFKYNLETNIPEKIGGLTYENAAEHAIENGVIGGLNQMFEWDCDKAIRAAYHVMEDANCHTEAKELVKFIPEYQ